MRAECSLRDWLDDYVQSHDITEETAAYYRRSVRVAEGWHGAPLTLDNLSDRIVNSIVVSMLESGRSPNYVRSIQQALLALWRDAAVADMCRPPRRIRTIRCSRHRPAVWTPQDIRDILASAGRLRGTLGRSGLCRRSYWSTLIRTAWDTGLRRKDLHRLTRADLTDGAVWMQHKTDKPVRLRLRASTLEAIDRWGRLPDDVLWPLWGSETAFQAAWRSLIWHAGVQPGPFRRIRKSAGTAAEEVQPGAGHFLLGNTRAVFEHHYLDESKIIPPQPPEID